jgi:hypothetical protein
MLQMGADYNIFVPMVGKTLSAREIQYAPYDTLVARLLKNQPLVPETGADDTLANPAKHAEAGAEDTAISTFLFLSFFFFSPQFKNLTPCIRFH